MESISGVGWLWRALRGRSVTFAALFATMVLGVSVIASLRHLLHRVDAPWWAGLLVPLLLIAFLAKKETEWMPDPEQRLKWARLLIFGSILAAILTSMLLPQPPREPPPERVRRHGPPAR